MTKTLTLINACLFVILALIHLYWFVGGRWAINMAVPTNRNGRKVFDPGPFSTFIVAGGLIGFAIINLASGGFINPVFQINTLRYVLIAISMIFFLRVIGDFRYIGLFKSYRNSIFARHDDRIYIPLSLLVALSHGALLMI